MTEPKPAREIPVDMTVVDMTTGKETPQRSSFKMLPPAADRCQICAERHPPESAHNAQSLYYQMAFHGIAGRYPTWADAVAHCDDKMKAAWKAKLTELGKWTEPAGETPIKHHGVE